ncbi:MAG: glycosyltransferase [Phycisphaeraceae bacterium]|nr:glycosyltransferase [Phycisphaeraceae bacterium]
MPEAPTNHAPDARTGWPRTDRPLRIALLGWARLSSQGFEGSGYNLSASELARGLALSGHEVAYLSSGMSYHLFGGPRIAFRERWGGIDCHELINSPNLSPNAHNFRNTQTEIACPAQAALVVRWLDQVRAQVIHVHSLEGYGLDLIGAIRASGRPVVVTPHNYSYVCPQVDLLHQEARVCTDYDGGRRCTTCLPAPDPRVLKRKRAVGDTLERWLGLYPADVVRKAIYGIGPAVRSVFTGAAFRPWSPPKLNPDDLHDPELARGFDISGRAGAAASVNGAVTTDSLPAFDPSPADQNERLLAANHHLRSLNIYGQRRAAGVEALNHASLVIPPSDFLRRLHVAMGVDERRLRWVRLGQPHFDQINRRARRSPYYDARPWDPESATRPLRFAYFGTTRPNKGLEVLLRAIPLIAPEVRSRLQISIHAGGHDAKVRRRMAKYTEVSVRGAYDLAQLLASGGEYDVGILPHIWLENSPLVMLEHLHAGKFVIASRLGGPPDWISPPRNGLLFPAGHPAALAECITRVTIGEVPLPSPREIHAATVLQSYPDHVREIESIYRELLAGGPLPVPSIPGKIAAEAIASAAGSR